MQFNKSFALLFSFGYVLAASAHVTLKNGWTAAEEIVLPGISNITNTAPEGYTAAPLRWFGQAAAGGPNITIVGRDINHVQEKLRELNPDFDTFNRETLAKQAKIRARDSAKIKARDGDGFVLCTRSRFRLASYPRLEESIDYLKGISGFCVVDGPKDSCNRCSCSWGAGVWMCNDSTRGVTHQFMFCTDMASRGDQVVKECKWGHDYTKNYMPIGNGQFFQTQYEYSVLMAGTDC